MRLHHLLTVTFSFVTLFATGQKLNPVDWSFSSKQVGPDEYEFYFDAKIQDGWYVYAQNIPEDGPIPTSINIELNPQIKLLGKPVEQSAHVKEGHDEIFNMKIKKFAKEVRFVQKVKTTQTAAPLKGYVEFMTCDNAQCLPPKEVSFSIPFPAPALSAPNSTSTPPPPVVTEKPSVGTSAATADKPTASTPSTDVTNSPASSVADAPVAPATLSDTIVDTAAAQVQRTGLAQLAFDKTDARRACADVPVSDESTASLWWIFFLGLLGGFAAILTPCVFPLIPLTVSFFTKRSKDRATGIRNALVYGLSIIAIYTGLGLLITLAFGADALNQLSTNAWFNILLFALLIVFALSFFGYFELTLPSSWANSMDRMSDRGGLLGILFMAFTLAIVSFSCTGPLIGNLLVVAVTEKSSTIPIKPAVGMFGFSLALALPFSLFSFFPSWLQSLPKSGGWMDDVKVTLGFIEVALAFKFLSVADLTMGWKWKIVPYELFIAVWVLCALGLALYFLGRLRFPHTPRRASVGTVRGVLAAVCLVLAVYFASGFRVREDAKGFVTPNLLSGVAPPAGHSYIFPRHCPMDLDCYNDFEEGMAVARSQNKPVLLDFTGHGCVNCRRMEDNVWSQDPVYKMIKNDYVLISLYVDDRERLKEPIELPDRTLRNVGNKWAWFQETYFDRVSQPYYVLLSPDQRFLNQPVAYTPDASAYAAFLRCGLDRFRQLQAMTN